MRRAGGGEGLCQALAQRGFAGAWRGFRRSGPSPFGKTLDHVQSRGVLWNPFSNQNVHHSGASRERQYIDTLKTLIETSLDIPGDWIYRSNPKNWISNQKGI